VSTPAAVKVVLRLLGGATAGALVLGGGYTVATQLATTQASRQLDLDAAGVRSLVVRVDIGRVRIEQTTAAAGRIEGVLRQEGSWTMPTFESTRSGDELVLDGSCHGRWFAECATDLVLRVPRGLALDARASVGDVSAAGAFSDVALETSTGDVSADELDAGSVSAVSSVGDVRVRLVAAPEQVDVVSSVGDVRVVVPDDGTAYDVQTQIGVGDSQTTVPVDSASPNRIRVTSSVGDVRVLTESEDQP
jgi:hypothetical protein